MGVWWCKEITGRDSEETAGRERRRTRTFQVMTEDPTDGSKSVLAHAELPAMYAVWVAVTGAGLVTDTDPNSVCVNRVARQDDPNDLNHWTVTCSYAGLDDPTYPPAKHSWGQVKYQKSLIEDENGNPVQNSAKDPFEGGVPVDRSRGVLTVEKAIPKDAWDPIEADEHRDTVNELTMFADTYARPYPPFTMKMVGLEAEQVWYPGFNDFYWLARATIETNRGGWKVKLRDAGFNAIGQLKLFGADVKTKIILPGGLTPANPHPLKDGRPLRHDEDPVTLEFDGYLEKDWSGLTWLED